MTEPSHAQLQKDINRLSTTTGNLEGRVGALEETMAAHALADERRADRIFEKIDARADKTDQSIKEAHAITNARLEKSTEALSARVDTNTKAIDQMKLIVRFAKGLWAVLAGAGVWIANRAWEWWTQ